MYLFVLLKQEGRNPPYLPIKINSTRFNVFYIVIESGDYFLFIEIMMIFIGMGTQQNI